ncbi:MAG: hypothetical protein B7Y99_00420 [Caulobacterales bacterium 32-69-10]|nr:MAG: hypothetical protein B7Y99_00420 [Caulobacterales bacterium 32-69-10]
MRPDAEKNQIDLVFDLPHSIAKVWKALTTPALLARWLAPNDMVPRLGARFTVTPEDGPPVACEVIEIEAKRRLALAWRVSEADATVVRFELAPAGAGTVLRISHAGVGAIAVAPAQPPRLRARAPSARRAPAPRTQMKRAA